MKKIFTFVYWGLIVLVAFLVIILSLNALSYINFDSSFGFLRLKEAAIATGWYLPFYYAHVLAAGIILLVGFIQVIRGYPVHLKSMHKYLGKVYAYGILFFAAPGGLVMSLFIQRGPWVLISFLLQTVLWFVCTAVAVHKIRQGDLLAHRHWMLRSYALTFAAVTLRLYVFFTVGTVDLSHPSAYGIIAWLSWTLNLVVVEIYVKYRPKTDLAPLS